MTLLRVALISCLLAQPAAAATFTVEGTFAPGSAPYSGNTLSGTIDITGGVITAADLVVTGIPSHFTNISSSRSNSSAGNSWVLAINNVNTSPFTAGGEDNLGIFFEPDPGAFLIGFTQGRINTGSVLHSQYDPITTVMITTAYGISLKGTICPPEGCHAFPLPAPGPIAGAGLPGLLALGLLLWRRRMKGQHV